MVENKKINDNDKVVEKPNDECDTSKSCDDKNKKPDLVDKKIEVIEHEYQALLKEKNELSINYERLNEKFIKFVKHLESIELKYKQLNNELEEHKRSQLHGCKIRIVDALMSFCNSLRIIKEQDDNKDIVILNILSQQMDNIFSDWKVEFIVPQHGDVYDASIHNVICNSKANNKDLTNKVSKTINMGYKIDGKVVKSAEIEIFS